MEKANTYPPVYPRDLGNELIMRRSTPADADALAEFNIRIHSDETPEPCIGIWTRDLLKGTHPTFGVDDFLIIERKSDHKIVSSTNLISQTWTYGGIPFGVGRPELVGTDPEFRRRGLVRLQMDELHTWSRARGEMVQAITGIPNYYRQFGYEMTVDSESGRFVHHVQFKPLAEGEHEPYNLRKATPEDIPLLVQVYNSVERRQPLSCARTAADWLYEITENNPENCDHADLFMIEDADHLSVGMVAVNHAMWGTDLAVLFYGLLPGNSYLMVTPAVLRFLWHLGQERVEKGKICTRLQLLFGENHPAFATLHPNVSASIMPYAYFMRVEDIPGFLGHIKPVLEDRLANSPCSGHTGDLRISFYKGGLNISLEKGLLAKITPYQPEDWRDGEAFFPDLTFLQLLFQSKSMAELRESYTDCSAKTDAQALLNAMFPRSPSCVWVKS